MILDAFTLYFLVVAIATLIVVIVEYNLVPTAHNSDEEGKSLLQAIRSLRLNRMLRLMGIPLARYMASVPLTEIKKHVTACRGCTEVGACDRCLRKGVLNTDMSFCPNYEYLSKYKGTSHPAG